MSNQHSGASIVWNTGGASCSHNVTSGGLGFSSGGGTGLPCGDPQPWPLYPDSPYNWKYNYSDTVTPYPQIPTPTIDISQCTIEVTLDDGKIVKITLAEFFEALPINTKKKVLTQIAAKKVAEAL